MYNVGSEISLLIWLIHNLEVVTLNFENVWFSIQINPYQSEFAKKLIFVKFF